MFPETFVSHLEMRLAEGESYVLHRTGKSWMVFIHGEKFQVRSSPYSTESALDLAVHRRAEALNITPGALTYWCGANTIDLCRSPEGIQVAFTETVRPAPVYAPALSVAQFATLAYQPELDEQFSEILAAEKRRRERPRIWL